MPFFGPVAFMALGVLYVFSPYIATNWFHVNSRFIPFLWLAALVRLPERLLRRLAGALGACAPSRRAWEWGWTMSVSSANGRGSRRG